MIFFLLLEATSSGWVSVAPMNPPQRRHAISLGCGEGFFAIGGRLSNGSATPLVSHYHPPSNTWSSVAPLIEPKFSVAAAPLNNNSIFVFGGYLDSDYHITPSVEMYDCSTRNWTIFGRLPLAVAGASAIFVPVSSWGAGIILAGGFYGDNLCTSAVYFFAGNKFHVLFPMNFARGFGSLVLHSTILYSLDGSGEDAAALNTAEKCDVTQGCKWQATASSPYARNLGSAVEIDGQLFAIGGFDVEIRVQSSVDVFDISSEGWSSGISLPKPRIEFAAVAVGNMIYVCGGVNKLDAKMMDNSTLKFELN